MEPKRTPLARPLIAFTVAGLVVGAYLVVKAVSGPPFEQNIVYSVYIGAPEGTTFAILVPYPVEANGSVPNWISTLRVDSGGPGGFGFMNSEHGPALLVEGHANMSLVARGPLNVSEDDIHRAGSRHPGGAPDLNLWAEPPSEARTSALGPVWVYLDPSHQSRGLRIGLSLGYNFGCYSEWHGPRYGITATDGWQQVDIESQSVVC